MDFQSEIHDDILVFEILNKRATVEISGNVKSALLKQIDEGKKNVIVNLEKAEYVDGGYYILDAAYVGDTHWGSKMKRLSDEYEIIR